MKAIAEAAKYQPDLHVPIRAMKWCEIMGLKVTTPPNEEHDPRQYIDEVE